MIRSKAICRIRLMNSALSLLASKSFPAPDRFWRSSPAQACRLVEVGWSSSVARGAYNVRRHPIGSAGRHCQEPIRKTRLKIALATLVILRVSEPPKTHTNNDCFGYGVTAERHWEEIPSRTQQHAGSGSYPDLGQAVWSKDGSRLFTQLVAWSYAKASCRQLSSA